MMMEYDNAELLKDPGDWPCIFCKRDITPQGWSMFLAKWQAEAGSMPKALTSCSSDYKQDHIEQGPVSQHCSGYQQKGSRSRWVDLQ